MDNLPLIHGHRGCRGLMPENSIPGFLHAIELGCRAIELDVVISKDKQVVVSHEPFLSRTICTDLSNKPLQENKDRQLNLYEMNYDTIKKYDCGSRFHPNFLKQQKLKIYKPLLSELIEKVNSFCEYRNIPSVLFNIEIKSKQEEVNVYQPDASEFSELVLNVINEYQLHTNCIIQSFDSKVLKVIREKNKQIKLAFLSKTAPDIPNILETLDFTPEYLSPYFEWITENIIQQSKNHKMKILAWTVNEIKDLTRMIDLEVDGIITDYPNLAFDLLQSRKR